MGLGSYFPIVIVVIASVQARLVKYNARAAFGISRSGGPCQVTDTTVIL